MVNTTDLYWSVDGVSLNTHAQNIESLAGLMAPPEMRGEDQLIPYAIGEKWVEKIPDSRILPLGMWVIGNTRDEFDDNWAALVKLLWTPGRQFNLTKRFRRGGITYSATAKAEFVGGLQPSMIGRKGAKFTVDLKLADPYFYDDALTTLTISSARANYTVLGDAPTHNLEFVIDGSRGPLEFINWTNDHDMILSRATASNELTRIYTQYWQAWREVDGGGINDISSMVRHNGGNMWMTLDPGINDIQMVESAPVGTGLIQIKARGAWL
jgi:hypothetical protein